MVDEVEEGGEGVDEAWFAEVVGESGEECCGGCCGCGGSHWVYCGDY